MFKYLLFGTILSFLLFRSAAYAELGFLDPNDPSVPQKVRQAASSVFHLRIVPFHKDSSIILDLSKKEASKAVEGLFRNLKDQGFDELDAQILNSQIQSCVQEKEYECEINLKIGRGTGFLVDVGSEAEPGDQFILTNAHLIEDIYNVTQMGKDRKVIQDMLAQNIILDLGYIYIFNNKREMIFNPDKEKMNYIQLPDKTPAAKLKGSFYAADSDKVLLYLHQKRNLGKPLKIAKEIPKANENIYLIGYPACTNCSEGTLKQLEYLNRSSGNSNGRNQYVTVGKLMPAVDALNFFDMNNSIWGKLFDIKKMLFHTADSNYGSSGSPVLNSKGEVIGLHSGGTSKMEGQKHIRKGRGVFLNSLVK